MGGAAPGRGEPARGAGRRWRRRPGAGTTGSRAGSRPARPRAVRRPARAPLGRRRGRCARGPGLRGRWAPGARCRGVREPETLRAGRRGAGDAVQCAGWGAGGSVRGAERAVGIFVREAGALCVWRDGEPGALCAGLGRCAQVAQSCARGEAGSGECAQGAEALCLGGGGVQRAAVLGSWGWGWGWGRALCWGAGAHWAGPRQAAGRPPRPLSFPPGHVGRLEEQDRHSLRDAEGQVPGAWPPRRVGQGWAVKPGSVVSGTQCYSSTGG